jgi:pyruvate dehydrogenase E2 component (dihydrolipoamide acetyltransferase)
MAITVEMPKMSDTMEEGVLVSWLVKEGAKLSAGDVIAQVETDKATMDLEVYDDGVLLKIVAEEGGSVPIGGLIAILGTEGEDVSSILARYSGDGAPPARPVSAETESQLAVPAASLPSGDGAPSDGRVKVSPLARKMASEGSIDLRSVQGTGPEGRIIKRDIEAALAAPGAAKPADPVSSIRTGPTYESVPISQMRKTIARRLGQSKFTAPHFYLNIDVDMEQVIDARSRINLVSESQGRSKVSFNDLIVKACALALREHPAVNSSWVDEAGEMRRHRDVHVAVAVAIDDGLVTPVVRNADLKGLAEISSEVRHLAGKARDRTLGLDEMEGSTFTTSNLGMLGIDDFTAIINPPNSCILAIGGIRDVPVVKDGTVVPGKRMRLTLSCDHRIVDGATGARFLGTVRQFLEIPTTMLL